MAEMRDYSGAFRADFKPQNLTQDAIIRMWMAASVMYLAMDKIWFGQVAERFGENIAFEMSLQVWSKASVAERKRSVEALNIRGMMWPLA
ncbi:MAG: DUF6125 family protein [Dehalococcoidia bacterium]|nr:DUF6125 family protein [Dehalococcoidia bacterium]